jgi:uncharacterized RDD family membrane protein YckC
MVIIEGRNKNLGKRFYANLFDYFILFILYGIYIFTMGDQDESGTYRVTGLKALVLPLLWILYFPVCESIQGQTIGKKAFNLHIVDFQGEKPTIVHAFLRRMLDLFEMMCFGVAALLAINYSPKNQRIGDMIAGTTVIRTDAVCRLCGTELELTPKEVIRDTFKCPHCNELN